jgi:pyruvate dehydrogenase kinase 2/3/4
MQLLPYVVVTNPHFSEVYDLYYNAFDAFRKVREIRNLDDNDRFCKVVIEQLRQHVTVIPKLAKGVLECDGMMEAEDMDKFMNTILRSVSHPSWDAMGWAKSDEAQRISRRVIAEQHLSLTETLHAPEFSPGHQVPESEFIGNVFLKCIAKDVIERCGQEVSALLRAAYGPDVQLPQVKVEGHLDASFPFILSHLEYIIGELLRNSVQGVVEQHQRRNRANSAESPPDIHVTICDSPQHVTIRVSDRGGGIPRDVLAHLWSFSKGPQSQRLLANLGQVPRMAGTLQELKVKEEKKDTIHTHNGPLESINGSDYFGSLSSLTSRPPNLRLGMGLPLSRVYAEYWAGSLTLHSLAGYGVDVFLGISKLGNKNEQLTTRALVDAV